MPSSDEEGNGSPFHDSSENRLVLSRQAKLQWPSRLPKNPTMKVLLELKYFFQQDQRNRDPEAGDSEPAEPLPESIKTAFGDQVTDANSAIKQLFEISKTNVDAWYLAGTLAVSEERWDDAAASF